MKSEREGREAAIDALESAIAGIHDWTLGSERPKDDEYVYMRASLGYCDNVLKKLQGALSAIRSGDPSPSLQVLGNDEGDRASECAPGSPLVSSPMTEKDTAAIPVAWMTEDGRVATASAKPNMPSAAKEAFNIALFPHPQGQPARVDVDRIIAIFREHTRAEVGVKDESEWKEPEWVKFENGLRARLEALNEQP